MAEPHIFRFIKNNFEFDRLSVEDTEQIDTPIYIYIYVYTYICPYIYIYIYVHIYNYIGAQAPDIEPPGAAIL